MKPKINWNMFCKNMHYIHVMKAPKVAPLVVWFHPIVIHVYFIHTTSLIGDKEF
jgi:hypothetical protein